MRNGFAWRGPLTVAMVIAAGVSCRGDTVVTLGCLTPLIIVLPGEYPFRSPEAAAGLAVTLKAGGEQDLLLALQANERPQWERCAVPPGNRFVWTTLDPTVAAVYATGDSTARVRAVSAGETVIHVRAEPATTYRAERGVTVVP